MMDIRLRASLEARRQEGFLNFYSPIRRKDALCAAVATIVRDGER